ncbi:MAG TPA: glycosyltransferase [Anaerolineales bacterium]|nr:glycosyltransferase [Anaerolineales bacterium]
MLSYHTSPLAALGGKHSGGMNVYVRELSAHLAKRGHRVDVFTRGVEDSEQRIADGARLITLAAGPRRELEKNELAADIPEFAQRVQEFAQMKGLRYDLIHAHYWMSGLVGRLLKASWGVPLAVMFHTLGLVKNRIAVLGERESDERIRGERRTLAASDLVVASTPGELADLQWLYELPSARAAVIPPGVDLQQFHPMDKTAARAELGLPTNERQILFVGRIEALKGIDTLIRATDRVVRTKAIGARIRVQIIGGDVDESLEQLGSEMARLRRLTADLGLQERVRFLGSRRQRELPPYYAAADVVVMPSYSESFGMVALEAMACGRPVVASRVGGLEYLVQDGITGFHVQEGNAEEMAARLEELLGDAVLLERMGAAARREAEMYSWERTANEIEKLYKNLL